MEREPTHYRFVHEDGRTTSWRKIPKYGVSGVQYTRARARWGRDAKFGIEFR